MIRDETARIATNRAKTVRFPSIQHDSHEIRETHRTQSKSATAFDFEPGLPFWGRFVSKLGALGSKLGGGLGGILATTSTHFGGAWLQIESLLGHLGAMLVLAPNGGSWLQTGVVGAILASSWRG